MANGQRNQGHSPVLRRAFWNGAVLAQSDDVIRVEGNDYFPADALRWEHFVKSSAHSLCPWKGIASYFDIVVDGIVNPHSAWHYRHQLPFARKIKGRVAFWQGVDIEIVGDASQSGASERT